MNFKIKDFKKMASVPTLMFFLCFMLLAFVFIPPSVKAEDTPIWGDCKTCHNPVNICPIDDGGGPIGPIPPGDGTLNCPNAAAIPAELRQIFEAAGASFGVDAALVAAIFGYGEHHDGNGGATWPTSGPWACSYAGACGPFQFIPSTWDAYGVDGDGDGVADINNLVDAAYGAANYLCASGACSGDLYSAVFAYNHADWYVDMVLNGYNIIKCNPS